MIDKADFTLLPVSISKQQLSHVYFKGAFYAFMQIFQWNTGMSNKPNRSMKSSDVLEMD